MNFTWLNPERIIMLVLVLIVGFLYISNGHYKNKAVENQLTAQTCNNSIEFAGYLADKSIKDARLELDKTDFSLRVARDNAKVIGEGAGKEIGRLEALEIVSGDADSLIESLDIMIIGSLKL